jgi:HEAT repeat protein
VRYAAARTLGALRSAKVLPALAEAAKDKDAGMRRAAATTLGQIGDKAALPTLKTLLADAEPLVRGEAIRSLTLLADPSVVPVLTESLKDSLASVRLQAALALARLGSSAGAPVAYAALKDKEADAIARQQAANTISLVGDEKSGLKALNEAFAAEKDPNAKGVIDFARAQLKARLGMKDQQKPAPKSKKKLNPAAKAP